jgi:hypothetical protein
MATVNQSYAASQNHTITLASLATSSTLLAGRASTAIDESSNLYLDELLAGFFTVGSSPVAGEIAIYCYGNIDGSPTYPGYASGNAAITGSDAAFTFVTSGQRDSALRFAHSITTAATTGQKYSFGPISVASLFGGRLPKYWGVWVSHSTTVNLDSTAGNHQITSTGIEETVV